MKKNIVCRPSKDVKEMFWYSYEGYCDECGELFITHASEQLSKPDETEKDYCIKCMRKFLNNKEK